MRRLQDLIPGLLMTGLGIGFMVLTFHVNGIPTIGLWGVRLLSVVIMIGGFCIVKGALQPIDDTIDYSKVQSRMEVIRQMQEEGRWSEPIQEEQDWTEPIQERQSGFDADSVFYFGDILGNIYRVGAYIVFLLILLYIMKLNQFAVQAFIIWGFPIVFVLYKFIREVIRLVQTLRDDYFKTSVLEVIQNIKEKTGKK